MFGLSVYYALYASEEEEEEEEPNNAEGAWLSTW